MFVCVDCEQLCEDKITDEDVPICCVCEEYSEEEFCSYCSERVVVDGGTGKKIDEEVYQRMQDEYGHELYP